MDGYIVHGATAIPRGALVLIEDGSAAAKARRRSLNRSVPPAL